MRSQRGPEGGYRLPLASVCGEAPEELAYDGAADALQAVWVALRANLRAGLDEVTLGDVADGELPAAVVKLTRDPQAWVRR